MPVAIFDLSIIGPPPGGLTCGANLWIDLGTIPVGKKIWFGRAIYTSPSKSLTFEIRTNNAGQSAGSDAATRLLYSASVSPRSGNLNVDLYKNGRLHTASNIGTGPEKFWLRLKSKSSTAGSFLYSLYYTLE